MKKRTAVVLAVALNSTTAFAKGLICTDNTGDTFSDFESIKLEQDGELLHFYVKGQDETQYSKRIENLECRSFFTTTYCERRSDSGALEARVTISSHLSSELVSLDRKFPSTVGFFKVGVFPNIAGTSGTELEVFYEQNGFLKPVCRKI